MAAGVEPGAASKATTSAQSLIDLTASVKADLLAGGEIRLLNFQPEQRQFIIGIIAKLRDDLPIKSSWVTVRESFLSETRLRARRYRIDGEYLHVVQAEGGDRG